MLLRTNKVRQAYDEGRPSFGTYVMSPSTRMIEMLGFAGLDFVRIDIADTGMDIQTVERMIHTAHAVGVTPFVRVPSADAEWHIHAVLKMGALGIIVPRVTGPEDIEKAVRATKTPPVGERHAGPGLPTGGYGLASAEEYAAWADKNIILSVQVETKEGVESIEEIVKVPGLDMVQSGRGDLSYHYGVPGQQYHPDVLEAERTVVDAGLAAGMMVSVQYYPLLDSNQIPTIKQFIDEGIHCLSLGSDRDIVAVYRRLLAELR